MRTIIHFFRDNWFKVAIIGLLIFITSTVYDVLVAQPERQAARDESAKLLERITAEDKETQKQENIDKCLAAANENYKSNWNNSCRTLGKLTKSCEMLLYDEEAYDKFLAMHAELEGKNDLDKLYEFSKASTDCTCLLPGEDAQRWDKILKENEQACYDRY